MAHVKFFLIENTGWIKPRECLCSARQTGATYPPLGQTLRFFHPTDLCLPVIDRKEIMFDFK
jgi:hypothetical protein